MNKHGLKQHAVHANGYTINYTYTNGGTYTQYTKNNYTQTYSYKESGSNGYSNHTNYGNHSNYGNHGDYGRYNWADWHDFWPDSGWRNHTDYGGYGHSNSGGYSQGGGYSQSGYGRYNDHTNYTQISTDYTQAANEDVYSKSNYTQESSRTPQNVLNKSATLTNKPTPNAGILNRDTVVIDWTGVSYDDDGAATPAKYKLYYSYCATENGTYGDWTLLSEQTGQTFSWDISSSSTVKKGYYKIAITAYDGYTWSALPSGNSWTYHYIDTTTAETHVDPGSVAKTISYALGGPIKIVHYDPPTWLSEYYTKAAMDQIREETDKSRAEFDLSGYTFSTSSFVSNFTIITIQDFAELDAANNETYHLYKGDDYTFNPDFTSATSNVTEIKNSAIDNIRDLINHLKN